MRDSFLSPNDSNKSEISPFKVETVILIVPMRIVTQSSSHANLRRQLSAEKDKVRLFDERILYGRMIVEVVKTIVSEEEIMVDFPKCSVKLGRGSTTWRS